jgi:hypothetical protein
MAGRPMRRALIAELERRAAAAGLEGPLDVIHDWVTSGQTLKELSLNISKTTGKIVSAGTLSTYINSTPEGRQMITAARALAAAALAEEALELLDNVDEDKNAIAKAKEQANMRTWLASRWNRKEYGSDAGVNVNIVNMGQLHLDALRHRATVVRDLPGAKTALNPGNDSGEASDAEFELLEENYGKDE